jgi:hypothetical protein
MPDKTARLEALLPEVYAAREADGLLHRLLDTIGVRLADADAAVKGLLVSHWLEHARGAALDALGATFGQQRRVVQGAPETDEALRQRLRTIVARFTGGGTVAAVKGAVRSALGLPFDLTDVPLPPGHPMLQALDALVTIEEFSPERVVLLQQAATITVEGNRSRLELAVELESAQPDRPAVELRATRGVARNISVELSQTGEGLRADAQLAIAPGETLVLETVLGAFEARVVGPAGQRFVTHLFRALDGAAPQVPLVPVGPSTWVFRAGSGFPEPVLPGGRPVLPGGPLLPGGPVLPGGRPVLPGGPLLPGGPVRPAHLGRWSAFDEDTFDLPEFGVSLAFTRRTPLTFDVTVPYFLAQAVAALRARYDVHLPVFTHEGLPREQLQGVVDATRAAGVRGRVRLALGLPQAGPDLHDVSERLGGVGVLTTREDAQATEAFSAGSVNSIAQQHDQDEAVTLLGVFGVSTFDSEIWGFGG